MHFFILRLRSLKTVSEEYAKPIRENGIDEIYPVVQTENFVGDPRVSEFGNYVAQTSWNILESQGYDMMNYTTQFNEMWMQEHYKHSAMEEHMHKGAAIVGFYILEVPENSSKVVFYDPRPGKIMGSPLAERDMSQISLASDAINFSLAPGDLILTNAWLPHAFSRHGADTPLKFIHCNVFSQRISDVANLVSQQPPAEII